MEKLYITRLQIEKVRHLKNITIPLGENRMDHLIITGKNGSGKTSLLDAMATYLENVIVQNKVAMARSQERLLQNSLNNVKGEEKEKREYRLSEWKEKINEFTDGVEVTLNMPESKAARTYKEGNCILTYYKADRIFQADIPEYVEKIQLKSKYGINETPRKDFVKYLLDLKMTEALAVSGGKTEKAGQIREWFVKLEALLRKIFEDDTLTLEFDEETFQFFIHMSGREKFDFNSMSSGYSAIWDIVADLMLRMEKQSQRTFRFDMPGIVLIDEIETHLHLELQKKIMEILTGIFPNIQFVVTTHSPFILNSLENVVIYDLENHTLVENGLTEVPYEGIVEGYFQADSMSDELKGKFERYKELTQKSDLTDDDLVEIAKLETYLDEIPDFLAWDISTEYRRMKLEFENREDA
ncbi:MAG TPA: AAA family ATPase [Candidatus Eisenbergiella intestinipullorum]|nr:AAA family ATPase [Candidatus Eisenbergiella intestinipullorum]